MQLNFSAFPKLSTERLILRRLTKEDAEQIFALRSNELVNKYLNRPKATSIDDAKNFIAKINLAVNANQSLYWAICLKDQTKLVGTICLWNFSEEEEKAEIGYELLPQFQGKGMMQEAFSKVIEFGFQSLELNSIEAWTVIENEGSKKILEKNGFRRNLQLENKIDRTIEGVDTIIYSLSKEMFKQQAAV